MSNVPCNSSSRGDFFRAISGQNSINGRLFTYGLSIGRISTMLPTAISRRFFLAGGIGLSAATLPPPRSEFVYEFAAVECDVRLAVAYYDRYSSKGFRFNERIDGRRFCLSREGAVDRDCPAAFFGSLAIARYRFSPPSDIRKLAALREHVHTIDR